MMRRLTAIVVLVLMFGLAAGGTVTPPPVASPANAPDGTSDWWAAAQQEVARSEYRITWARTILPDLRAAYQAPNRAHGLRTYFTSQGIRIVPRAASDAPAWEWRVRLQGYGPTGTLRPAAPARLVIDGHRAEYRRPGITEWYANEERGLEHGFTLAAPPSGAAGVGSIYLDLALGGTVTPTWDAAEQAVDVLTPGGVRVLRYGGLHAHDARGQTVPSTMMLRGSAVLRISLDARAAVYPITVDPISAAAPWTAESNQAGAYFGYSVSTAGDVNNDGYGDLVVGAPFFDGSLVDSGRVFIFLGSAAGLGASPSGVLGFSSGGAGAYLGWSVGTAGDVNGDGYSDVIAGAPLYEFNSDQVNEGAAFIFKGSATGITSIGSIIATFQGNQAGAQLGSAVGPAGDVNGDGYSDVIVGVPYYDNGQTDEGAAFVYHGKASNLGGSPAWIKEGNQASSLFGYAVATAGDVNGDGYADVIVGAPNYDNGSNNEGMAFIYRGSAAGLGTSSFWSKDGDQAGAGFGWSVGTAGDTDGNGYSDVVIGAPKYDNGQTNEGRIFVYYGGSSTMQPGWTAESNQAYAFFGSSVAPAGDVNGDGHGDVLAGAPQYDGGQTDEGKIFLFEYPAPASPGMTLNPSWTAESNQTSAFFGVSVGPAGDVNGDGYADIAAGATRYSNGQSQEGRVFVYQGRAGSLLANGIRLPESGSETSALAGYSVASAGDVNGDGYGDVAVGAPWWDSGETDEGAVFIWYGRRWGIMGAYDKLIQGGITGGRLGTAVAGGGDTNGDGYDDLFMSQPGANGGKGYVRGAMGSAGGISGLTWATGGTQANEGFGLSISGAGDVNGDGYTDLIVGAPYYDGGRGQTDEGRAYLYTGSQFGMGSNIIWIKESNLAYSQFGRSVSTAGDVNRDGYSDVIIGAPYYDNGQINEGRAFIYHGSAAGLPTGLPSATREINQDSALFGYSVASAGDVNGDGYSDVIVGSHLFDSGQLDEGGAFVFHGSASGISFFPNWLGQGDWAGGFFGWSVATAGDVNGDGYSDVIVGLPGYDGLYTDEGRAVAYHGGPSGLSPHPLNNWTARGNQANAQFGLVVASAGDVNGDGYADAIVGAPFFDMPSGVDAGTAFLFMGNSHSQRGNVPRQGRTLATTLIGLLGRSDGNVRLRTFAHGPFGRTQLKMEWELRPLGTSLVGIPTGSAPFGWQDTGSSGVEMAFVIGAPSSLTGYHWRMRLRFRPSSSPFMQYTRWFAIPRNGMNEKDFRTP